MTDMAALAAAVATRYAPAQVTAPAGGYRTIRLSTAEIPNQMTALPCVLVFTDSGEYDTGPGNRRAAIHTFIVRFYYDQTGDLPRAMVALTKWLTVLDAQMQTTVQLAGMANVVRVTTDDYKLGIMAFAGQDYAGIEMHVSVVTEETWAAVA